MTLNVLESTKPLLLSFKFRALSNLLFFYEPLIGPQPTLYPSSIWATTNFVSLKYSIFVKGSVQQIPVI